jgi:type II secretory pathway pseudopilin PulG
MQSAYTSTKTTHTSGFVMLEAVLALGLFTTVATAMVIALNQLSSANTDMRREALLLRTLESAMTEAAHRTPLEPRFETTPTDAFGVRVETQIEPLNLKNQRGQPLRGLFQVTVTATFDDGADTANPVQRSLEQTVFAEGTNANRRVAER